MEDIKIIIGREILMSKIDLEIINILLKTNITEYNTLWKLKLDNTRIVSDMVLSEIVES